MAKDFIPKKSNSHMNGFANTDISKGHKPMGSVPYGGDMREKDPFAKAKTKSTKVKTQAKVSADFDMDGE